MARNVALLAFGIVIGVVGGAALAIHAADETDMGVGDLTGVDGNGEGSSGPSAAPDLTVGTDAQQPPPAPIPEPPPGVWDRLAACESTSNWHINTGNGYSGGLQFEVGTWLAYGGGRYAPLAYQASRAQQIAVAERLHAARGYQPWPVCSRVVGLR